MLRARTCIQRVRECVRPSKRSAVVGLGITASLFLFAAESESKSSTQEQSELESMPLVDRYQFSALHGLLLPQYANCDSIFDKITKRGRKTSQLLESAYDVDWDNPLGEGGFGAVYLAINRRTGERVALKKMPKKYTDDASFQREMEALLAIQKAGGHPNVMQFRENFDEGLDFYLTMDYISGGEMFDHLINSGPYSEADAARLIREVASALSFLHGIGIVHCDLKPENLMLSTTTRDDSVVKVIDFGGSQLTPSNGAKSLSNDREGLTPAYCPPEVLNREKSKGDPSMDMWALGVILYIMLVGGHPFDMGGDASDVTIINRILNQEIPPLRGSHLTEHLSDSGLDLLEKLLCWDEKRRISADELLQHPWVRGVTAKRSTMEGSDSKLSQIRRFQSRLEVAAFQDFLSWSDEKGSESKTSKKMSLIERSFQKLDSAIVDGDEAISLTTFSNLLSEHMQNVFFKKGQVVYKEGDVGEDMLFINSGVVEITTADGFRTILKAGDFVGEGALLSDKQRSGTVTCVTPVHAIRITKKYFSKYLSQSCSELSLKMLETKKSRDASRTIFKGFSNVLTANMKNKSFQEGEVIYREGDRGNDMLFIKSGVVSVTNKEGFQTTLKQGDFVGEGALLSHKPRSSTVACLTPVEGMMISRTYFEKYLVADKGDLRLKMYDEKKSRDLSRIRTILRRQKYLQSLKLSQGDLLFKEGDSTKNLYIIIDGEVDLHVGNVTAYRVKDGDICGEHSLVFDSPRSASAQCSTKQCNVVEIGPRAFQSLLRTSLKESLSEISCRREFQKSVVFFLKKDLPKTEQELDDVFETIPKSCGDCIVQKDVRKLLQNMDPTITENEIRRIFKSIDIGGKGSINLDTFKIIFSM